MNTIQSVFRKTWKPLLALLVLGIVWFLFYIFKFNGITYTGDFQKLKIPELIDSRLQDGPIELSLQKGAHEFVPGIPSETQGFNGDYLGPTIRMHDGADTTLHFTNHIGEDTNVHGHGLHVSGELDGGEQRVIKPGDTWQVTLPIRQQASTNWYHPHLMHTTAPQVHSGLAGFYLIEDANSEALNIPKTYGVDDIPLAIQDRTFKNGVMNTYPEKRPDALREKTFVVNGTLNPEHKVPAGWVRLRLLNASNSRFYEFFLSGDKPFYKIATEGGFLNAPVKLDYLKMVPGERNEIMIDMSDGKTVDIIGKFLWGTNNRFASLPTPRGRLIRLTVDPELPASSTTLPKRLNDFTYLRPEDVVQTREFILDNMRINGAKMDMSVINERVKLGTLERWTISAGSHPFHVHGTSFQILSRNGKPPRPEDRGWKDTVLPNNSVDVLIRFDHEATEAYPYMYHCHILEHEDMGMMGQFTVE